MQISMLHKSRHIYISNPVRCRSQRWQLLQRPAAPTGSTYTAVDHVLESSVYRPAIIDVANLLGGGVPSPEQIAKVQLECSETGFLAVSGHGLDPNQLQKLFSAAGAFFDAPQHYKEQHIVQGMRVGRGYEVSPEHQQYMAAWQQQQQQQQQQEQGVWQQQQQQEYKGRQEPESHHQQQQVEPSAALGILSERFCCGPPLSDEQLQQPVYRSELGQVFFAPDAWPTAAAPELQPAMQQCYQQMTAVADALLRLFAAALGLPADYFQQLTDRHTSNMQVANYPSQLPPLPGPQQLRKKAHVDSGTLTLLSSGDWQAGSSWRAGDGGLQLLSPQGSWLEVSVPPGTLVCNLGSIMTRWTNGAWKATLHRVTNPAAAKAGASRRLSLAYFHKPNYDALIEVLPTCKNERASAGTSSVDGSADVAAVNLPPVLAAELTRQGIMHKCRHLPPEEASAAYHAELARMRSQ